MARISHYEVTDHRTGKTRQYKTSAAACRARDKIDLEHGAIITTRRAIWVED